MNAKTTSQITAVSGFMLATAFLLHLSGLHEWRQLILIIATITAGTPIALKAIKSLRMKAFSIDLLVTIAVIGALSIGEFVESSVVTFLFLFGAYLETRTLEKTRSSLQALIDMAPQEATVVREGKKVVISVEDLTEGDHVLIRSGEKVAVDGQVIDGQGALNEAAITGEPIPATKGVGDKVFSGTIVDNGYIEVIAEKVGDDTTFSKIIELVEEAQESKTTGQKFLDRFAQIYTPAVVFLSILVYFVTKNIEMSITFLVIACPGALLIGAPVSIVSGIGNGARHGVLIKGGDVMERLSKVDTVVFDKTGTLTRGRPEVSDIFTFGEDPELLLKKVAEAETISEHHLGKAIVKEAQARGITLSSQPEEISVIKGHGIRAKVEEETLIIGNRQLLESEGIAMSDEEEAYAEGRERLGNTAVFAAVDGKLKGIISIADQIRPDAQRAISKLRDTGVKKIIMLTGDNRYTAELVGKQLGLDEVHSELLPEQKVGIVGELKEEGRHVAMAGDGINDAPAIAAADIGIAMGEGGTDISMETADVVLMADRLDQFSHAYTLSKATVRNMKQNTYFAVGTVAFLLFGVLFGKVFLASGMFIHEMSVLLVILNALRLNRFNKGKSEQKAIPVSVS